jgi:predicted amidohydrolase
VIVMGMIEVERETLFNTAIVVNRGVLIGRYRKAHLLGGERIFHAGSECRIFEADGLRFGINICYDTNFPQAARKLKDLGASLIVCPANNMCRRETAEALKDAHTSVRGERCRETGLWLISADVTGERDEYISWGPLLSSIQPARSWLSFLSEKPDCWSSIFPARGKQGAVRERLFHCRTADELSLLFDKSWGGAQTDCQRGTGKFWHPTTP